MHVCVLGMEGFHRGFHYFKKKHVVLATHTCFLGGFRVSSCKLSVQRGSGHRRGAEREKGVVGGKGGGR